MSSAFHQTKPVVAEKVPPVEREVEAPKTASKSGGIEVSMGRPMVTGKIDQDVVANMLNKAEGSIKTCYEQAIAGEEGVG